jgi:hypothetical protein
MNLAPSAASLGMALRPLCRLPSNPSMSRSFVVVALLTAAPYLPAAAVVVTRVLEFTLPFVLILTGRPGVAVRPGKAEPKGILLVALSFC